MTAILSARKPCSSVAARQRRLSLNWQSERLTPEGVESVVSRALVPNLMWTWRQVDSLLEPRQGSVIQAQAGGDANLRVI